MDIIEKLMVIVLVIIFSLLSFILSGYYTDMQIKHNMQSIKKTECHES